MVLTTDRPIQRVSLSTPDIADALVTSPHEVLIPRKDPGDHFFTGLERHRSDCEP